MRFANLYKISLMICLLVPAIAYGQARIEQTSTTTPSDSLRLNDKRVNANADEVIRQAFQNMFAARSYRMHSEMTALNGATYQIEQEFAAPNRVNARVRSVANGSAMQIDAIIIGKNGYINTGRNWTRQKVDDQMFDFSKVQKQMDDALNTIGGQFEISDPSSVNGTPVTTYQFVSPTDIIFKVSVGTKDNMIYRVEFDSPTILSKNVHGQKVLITVTDYNTDIRIEPPM